MEHIETERCGHGVCCGECTLGDLSIALEVFRLGQAIERYDQGEGVS